MYKKNAEIQRPKRDCWKRIEAVVKMAQMTTNGFARHIGLPRGENLYQIKRGNNGVSLDLAGDWFKVLILRACDIRAKWMAAVTLKQLSHKATKDEIIEHFTKEQ